MADITLPVPGESPNWGTKLNTAILRINQELEYLGVQVSQIDSDLSSVTLRVTNLEGRVTDLEDNLEDIVRDIAADVIASDPAVIAAAVAAVDDAVDEIGVVSAIPKRSSITSSRTTMPIGWMERELVTTYPNVYPDVITGVWTNQQYREKSIPFVSDFTGRIPEQSISETIARVSQVPTTASIQALIDGSISGVTARRNVSPDFPILAGRLAVSLATSVRLPVVFTGSSSTARNPGYVTGLSDQIYSLWPGGAHSGIQWSNSADFSERTSAGIHVYNAAQGGTRAVDYLDDAESDKIAALKPAVIFHVVGANNYTSQTDPALYRSQIEARLDYLDGKMTVPCQHILVHAYAHRTFVPPTYPNSEYGDALQAIAAERPNVGFIDYSLVFEANGVPGPDPLGLIASDNIHPDPQGKGNKLIETTIAARLLK